MNRITAVSLVLGGMIVGACVAPQLSPKPSVADTQVNWEYKVISMPSSGNSDASFTKLLNDTATEGWELHQKEVGWIIFKRPKP